MNHIPIPRSGYTLEQLSALAIDQAVQIHIGVHNQDIAATPPVITIQVSAKNPDKVEAFRMTLDTADPEMNAKLSATMAQMVARVIKGRVKIERLQIVKP